MSTETSKQFADKLSDLISDAKVNGIDYRMLAKGIGISTGALSNYASDKQQPNISVLKKIACYFNVSADWLLGISQYPTHNLSETSFESLGISPHACKMLLLALDPFKGLEDGSALPVSTKQSVVDGLNLLLTTPSLEFFLSFLQHYAAAPRPSRAAESAMEYGMQYLKTSGNSINIPSGLLRQVFGFQLQREFGKVLDYLDRDTNISENDTTQNFL